MSCLSTSKQNQCFRFMLILFVCLYVCNLHCVCSGVRAGPEGSAGGPETGVVSCRAWALEPRQEPEGLLATEPTFQAHDF